MRQLAGTYISSFLQASLKLSLHSKRRLTVVIFTTRTNRNNRSRMRTCMAADDPLFGMHSTTTCSITQLLWSGPQSSNICLQSGYIRCTHISKRATWAEPTCKHEWMHDIILLERDIPQSMRLYLNTVSSLGMFMGDPWVTLSYCYKEIVHRNMFGKISWTCTRACILWPCSGTGSPGWFRTILTSAGVLWWPQLLAEPLMVNDLRVGLKIRMHANKCRWACQSLVIPPQWQGERLQGRKGMCPGCRMPR